MFFSSIHYHIGNDAVNSKQFEQAVDKFTDALTVDPENKFVEAFLLVKRAHAYSYTRNISEGIIDISTSITFYEQCVQNSDEELRNAFFLRSRLRRRCGDLRGSIVDLKSSWNIRKDDTVMSKWNKVYNKLKRDNVEQQTKYAALLSVNFDPKFEDVKAKHSALLRQNHPDKTKNKLDSQMRTDKTDELNTAYYYFQDVLPSSV